MRKDPMEDIDGIDWDEPSQVYRKLDELGIEIPKLTPDELYQELMSLFDKPVEQRGEVTYRMSQLSISALRYALTLTDSHCDSLDERIFHFLGEENYYNALVTKVLQIIIGANRSRLREVVFSNGPFKKKADLPLLTEDYFIHLLKRKGVLDANVYPLYWTADHYTSVDSKMNLRYGFTTFTNKGLVLRGPFSRPFFEGVTIRTLYYDDFLNRPYLQAIDLLDYDRISDIDLKWNLWAKRVNFKYETKYIEANMSSLTFPYFIKMLPKVKFKVKEGKLDIDVWFSRELAERKELTEEYYNRLLEYCSG